MPDGCVVGLVTQCDDMSGGGGGKKYKKLQVDIGAAEPLTIITVAPNVRLNTRTCIATVGARAAQGA